MAKCYFADDLQVSICPTRGEMGKEAAVDFAACVKKLLAEKPYIRVVFAAAPSQNDFLDAIVADESIDFSRIDAFHMDEYIGLPADAPQGFGNFLRRGIFDRRDFHSVSYLAGEGTAEELCAGYTEKLAQAPIDIVCMGIGENGHIAFNDPHVADFNDPKAVKVVSLDQTCRQQQVNDGCFASIDEVPTHAITLTIPTLANAAYHFCIVPTALKAPAVKATVEGPVSEVCPATVLRGVPGSILYLDEASASLLSRK